MVLYGKPRLGCIFDFDGVLVDTERYHFASWNAGAALAGIQLTWVEYLPLKSTGRSHIIDTIESKSATPFSPTLRTAIAAEKDRVFQEMIHSLSRSDILPGAEDFLESLSARNIPLAVASSSATTTHIAKTFGLDRYFSAIIDGNRTLPKKPAPDLFLTAANAINLPPEACLAFEDSLAGIQAARNAGMDVIAVGGIQSPIATAHIRDFLDILRERMDTP